MCNLFKVNKKRGQNDLIDMKTLRNIDVALAYLMLTSKTFHTFSEYFILGFWEVLSAGFTSRSKYRQVKIIKLLPVQDGNYWGLAKSFLEGGLKCSKGPATIAGPRRGFCDAEWLKRYISDPFQWDFLYSSLSFLAVGLLYIPWILIKIWAGCYRVINTGLDLLFSQN